ncbi:hypothetical protein WN51_00714 [Melipona quadrifasciata]|uniref:Uncharacterized protein n=1 Tax=Melipona quadrifasciata TaxID=166423 RepID=A0A0N0U4K5_9HYME|nr:hypothetical protein WN51_00714 [Melipona quadrifasciata]
MLVLRNFQNTNLLVLLGGLLLCLVFLIQVKQIYNNNQKYNRYLGYKEYMNEISTELKAVENSANKSSTYVRQLNEILLKQRDKDLKNVTVSRPVL